ncbi:hypothetical protein Tco_0550414 [Tanacetum coccineum]
MTKLIKEEFEKLGLLEIDDDLFTSDIQLGTIFNEFNRLSRINDDLFTFEIENLPHVSNNKPLEIKKQRDTYAREVDMEYNPSNLVFAKWLASKFYNHLEMDWYTKNALWVYWMRGDDEVFNEFSYLLKVDTELFTHDIQRTKTYEDYENELNNELDEPWSEDGVLYEIYHEWYDDLMDDSLKDEALMKKAIYEKSRGDATQSVINFCTWLKWSFKNFHELDYESLVKLQECWWKINDHECSPFTNWRDHICGPYANYYTNVLDEEEQEEKERCELFNDTAQEPPVCKIRRYEMSKYSFGQEEEYVATK